MKNEFKPYRLINSKELVGLQERFAQVLVAWNQGYALHPLELTLLQAEQKVSRADFLSLILLSGKKGPLALLGKETLILFKKSLFGQTAACFNQASEQIMLDLLEQLLSLKGLQLGPNTSRPQDWFYRGSSCLGLSLGNQQGQITFYLHPTLVLALLPEVKKTKKSLQQLNRALASKPLKLSVELLPLRLSLEQLLSLKVGDLIKTDHRHAQALRLQYQQETLCALELGQREQHKSILLRKSV